MRLNHARSEAGQDWNTLTYCTYVLMGARKDMQRQLETRTSRRFEHVQSDGRLLGRNGPIATLIRWVSTQGVSIDAFHDKCVWQCTPSDL